MGQFLIDKVFPFGLRFAPKVFSAIADALPLILTKKGIIKGLYYLYDFVLVAGSREEALRLKQAMLSTFENLQIPIEQSKLEGPDTCLTFLGIEIDTDQLQLHLPHEKLVDLKTLLAAYMGNNSSNRRSGGLNHPDPWTIEEHFLPTLHLNQPSTASNSVSSFIKVLRLVMTSMYLMVHSLSNYVCRHLERYLVK